MSSNRAASYAASMAPSSLPRGGELTRKAAGCSCKVQGQTQVPSAQNDLGRGGDELLLQREVQGRPEAVVF